MYTYHRKNLKKNFEKVCFPELSMEWLVKLRVSEWVGLLS